MTSKIGVLSTYLLSLGLGAGLYVIPVLLIPYLLNLGKKQGSTSIKRDIIRHIKRRKF